jgi:hypothetical protein
MQPQQFHLLLVEDDDLDVMNVHRALGQASEIMDAMRSYRSVAELAPLPRVDIASHS